VAVSMNMNRQVGVSHGAKAVDLPSPTYPQASRAAGEQGVVLIEAMVDASGRVRQMRVIESPGYPLLESAAKSAMRQARFKPAMLDGSPVACTVCVPFRFVLRG
jgi:protein TonB